MSENIPLKFIILGEGNVGKKSILNIFFNKKFIEDEKSTISPSFYSKTQTYKGKTYEINFWDTAGQEKFNAINKIYYQNSVGALIVYDVTIPETFEKAKSWVNTVREIVGKEIIMVIAGNINNEKINLGFIDKNKANIYVYCQKENCSHFYISSETGFNIEETFNYLITSVLKKASMNPNKWIKRGKGRKLQIKEEYNTQKKLEQKDEYFNEKRHSKFMRLLNKYINF